MSADFISVSQQKLNNAAHSDDTTCKQLITFNCTVTVNQQVYITGSFSSKTVKSESSKLKFQHKILVLLALRMVSLQLCISNGVLRHLDNGSWYQKC